MSTTPNTGHEVFVHPGRKRMGLVVGISIVLLALFGATILFSRTPSQTTWYENEARVDINLGDFLSSTPEQVNATSGKILCETLWKDHPTASFDPGLMQPYTEQLVSLVYQLVASDTPLEANMDDIFSELIAKPENVKLLQPPN